MAVEFALTPDLRWSADLATQARAARDAGFASLCVFTDRADDDARRTFDAAGIGCLDVLALMISKNEEATLRAAERAAASAAVMGAPWVTAVLRAPVDEAARRLVARCAAVLSDAGAAMALEFSPLSSVTSIGPALEIVDAVGRGAGVLIDTWHFFVGDSSWADLERLPVERIAYVQFDDAGPLESEDLFTETMDRRIMPGDGTFELERFASTLLDRGFDGVVSVEVLSRELSALPVPEFAGRARDAVARYWG